MHTAVQGLGNDFQEPEGRDDLGGIEGVKPISAVLTARCPGPRVCSSGRGTPLPGTRRRVTNASFGGGLTAPANLLVCSDFYLGCPGGKEGDSYLGHIQRNGRMLGAQPAPPCSLGPWPAAPGCMSSEHCVFCKEQASWAGQGWQVLGTGGGSHPPSCSDRSEGRPQGSPGRTAPKPCLWQ